MKDIIRDWTTYSRGSSQFEPYHFTYLLSELSDDEIESVFETYVEKEALIQRLNFYKNPGSIRDAGDSLVRDGTEYMKAISKLLGSIGENEISGLLKSIVRMSDTPVENSDLGIEINEIIGDHIDGTFAEKEHHYFGIFEALYGVSHSYQLAWAIGEPLLPFAVGGMNILRIFDYEKSMSIDNEGHLWIY